MKNLQELNTYYDKALSFYRKAFYKELKDYIILYSYETPVAIQRKDNKKIYFNSDIDNNLLFSNTTLRHIKEFIKQFYNNQDYKKKDLENNFNFISFNDYKIE